MDCGLPSSDEAKRAACATQEYVWEALGQTDSSCRSTWNSYYMNNEIYTSWLEQTESAYNQYYSNVSFNSTTQKLNYGLNSITDTSGVLQNYDTFTKNVQGITFSHTKGNNYLEITVSSSATGQVTFNSKNYGIYKLTPNGTAYSSSTMSGYIYFKFESGSVQNLIFSNYIEPSYFEFSVQIESGEITLVKSDIDTGNSDRIDRNFSSWRCFN